MAIININGLKLIHISDTHARHRELTDLPDVDIIVHSGDVCMAGTEEEVFDFVTWFCDLPYRNKVFIAGNHDDCLFGAELSGLVGNCHYLNNSSVIIEGLKFYGVPMFVQDSFTGQDKQNIQQIPMDTDVLITHQPPHMIMDFADGIHYGNSSLYRRVQTIHPQAHLFGHIHSAHGIMEQSGILYSNGAIIDDNYRELCYNK